MYNLRFWIIEQNFRYHLDANGLDIDKLMGSDIDILRLKANYDNIIMWRIKKIYNLFIMEASFKSLVIIFTMVIFSKRMRCEFGLW